MTIHERLVLPPTSRTAAVHRRLAPADATWDVVHVVEPDIGGAPAVAAQLARWEAESGLRVAFVGHPDSPALQADSAPFDRIGLELGIGSRMLRSGRDLGRILASGRVVHLHSSRAALIGRLANLGPRRPAVFTPHGWSWHVASPPARSTVVAVERALARWVTVLHALSPTEVEEATSLLGLDRDRIELIPNGVDLERFAPRPEGADHATRPIHLLVIGRLCRQKGQDILLGALALLRPTEPIQVTIAGEGPAGPALRDQAATLPAAFAIDFVGAVADPVPLYQAADLVVFPSRWEGQSLALLEAIAAGCAIVATAASGTEGAHGVATCEPTVASLADVVGSHLRDHRARRALATDAELHRQEVGDRRVRDRHLSLKQRLLELA